MEALRQARTRRSWSDPRDVLGNGPPSSRRRGPAGQHYGELTAGPAGSARRRPGPRRSSSRAGARDVSPKARRRALGELAALWAAGEELAHVALGDGSFEAGDAKGARAAWSRAPAAVAPGAGPPRSPGAIWRSRGGADPRARCRRAPRGRPRRGVHHRGHDRAARPPRRRALLAAGFPNTAERILLAALGAPGPTATAVATLLGDLRLARGDGDGAASAYTEALARDGSSPTLPGCRRRARGPASSGRSSGAIGSTTRPPPCGRAPSPRSAPPWSSRSGFARALATPSKDDNLPAGAAASPSTPTSPAPPAPTAGSWSPPGPRRRGRDAPRARRRRAPRGPRRQRPPPRGRDVQAKDGRALEAAANNAVAQAKGHAAPRGRPRHPRRAAPLPSGDAQDAAGSPATARTSALVALRHPPRPPGRPPLGRRSPLAERRRRQAPSSCTNTPQRSIPRHHRAGLRRPALPLASTARPTPRPGSRRSADAPEAAGDCATESPASARRAPPAPSPTARSRTAPLGMAAPRPPGSGSSPGGRTTPASSTGWPTCISGSAACPRPSRCTARRWRRPPTIRGPARASPRCWSRSVARRRRSPRLDALPEDLGGAAGRERDRVPRRPDRAAGDRARAEGDHGQERSLSTTRTPTPSSPT